MSAQIVLGITGSIGAYKAGDLVRRLRDHGATVHCVMTKEAREFITPLTLQVLSEQKVLTDLFGLEDPHVVHTQLADQASLVVIAPATANVIGKLANGLADDLLTCLVLATKAPVLIAPAMNVHMYNHPTVQENIKTLRRLGHRFVGPAVGSLACGYEAIGHLAEVDDIVRAAVQLIGPSKMAAASSSAPSTVGKPASRAARRPPLKGSSAKPRPSSHRTTRRR